MELSWTAEIPKEEGVCTMLLSMMMQRMYACVNGCVGHMYVDTEADSNFH